MIILKFKWWDDGSRPDTLALSPVEVHYNGHTQDWMLGSAIAWLRRNGYQPTKWSQDGLVSEIESPMRITRHTTWAWEAQGERLAEPSVPEEACRICAARKGSTTSG